MSRRSARLHEQDAFARETERQRELDQDIARLSPFFQRMLPGPGTSTPRSQRNRDRMMRAPRSEPSPIERERNQYIRHVFRTETLRRSPRRLMVPPVTPVRGRNSMIQTLYPMDPPSPTESEENTPTQSRQNSPSPPRSPVPEPREIHLIPPPNSPESGIPKRWERLAEDNINMGFGFALSWINTIKFSRLEAEERIILPRIYRRVPRKSLMCLLAHMNVDETVFHHVEVKMKSEVGETKSLKWNKIQRKVFFQMNMRKTFAEFVKLPIPFHRLRLKVDKYAEVPINQGIADKFEPVEYFRLDTKLPNLWILHQIVNHGPKVEEYKKPLPPNFEKAKKGREDF
ncbi:hypothetical protein CRE_14150 [Caenorhabditis remanei]|uniref:Uncharacterized protein n=1 Tax=Caenorhabditis remanei TaxID=31234 RepID=E3MRI6_CAERE|nr:hypothetical protein CRE_14150 [Caenorhabditis remanei]